MSKTKEAREVIFFSFLIASGIIGNLLGSLHELPASQKTAPNCPSSFMLELWKILLPLVTTLYEMQWLEVLVPTLAGNPTMPLKIYLSTTTVKHQFRAMGRKQQQSGSIIMSLCILHSTSHPCSFFDIDVPLSYIWQGILVAKLIWNHITNSLVSIVIPTMHVIIVTLITITVLPKLPLYWV